MPFSLLPREEEFFDLFIQVAHRSREAAEHLVGLFGEPDRAPYHAEHIKRLEHECDQITHEVVNRLDRTFITPIDREDIYRLAGDLDEVIDVIDGVARRAQIYRVGAAPEGVKKLTDVIQRALATLELGVQDLRKRDGVMEACIEAKRCVYKDLYTTSALTTMLPWQIAQVEEVRRDMGEDWWPYGFAANRHVLDLFLRYHHEQGLSPRRLQPEALFAPETLEEFRV